MDKFGKILIEAINKTFHTSIEVTEKNTSDMDSLFSDVASEGGFGYCSDCDKIMSDEPMCDESRD